MTVKHIGNGYYTCLAADTKPTNARTNAQIKETDTGKTFYFSGGVWVGDAQSRHGGHNKVYKIGSTYYAEKHDGTMISSSGTFETVLQAALDLSGDVYMTSTGTFTFNSAGVSIPTYTRLFLGKATILSPPASSSDFTCITIGQRTSPTALTRNAEVCGGRIVKNTGEKDWTAIEIISTTDVNGQAFCGVNNMVLYQPGTGIKITCSGTNGWISNDVIRDITMYYPIIGMEWFTGDVANGFKSSIIDGVNVQPNSTINDMECAFKNIRWKDITFRDCNAWDLANNNPIKSFIIAPDARDIRFEGGIMPRTPGYFVNNSQTRSIFYNSGEWISPEYGGIKLQVDGLFAYNGRRTGGHVSTTAADGWGITGGTWTTYSGQASEAETPFLSTNETIGRRFTTAASNDAGAGLRYPSNITCRIWEPAFKIRYRLNSPSTNRRVFFGWTSGAVDITSDDMLNGQSGMGLASRAADTTLQIAHNDGTGATNFHNTGVTINSTIRTFEMGVDEQGFTNKWKWTIYSTSPGAYAYIASADIPPSTTGMRPVFQIQTSDAVAKSFDVFGTYLETK